MIDYPDFIITLAHSHGHERQVTLAFAFGLKSLDMGFKTAIILLLDGVQVGCDGQVDDVDIGEPFLPVREMLPAFLEGGGQLMICASCWKHNGIPDGERLISAAVISTDDLIDYLMHARSSIQLN